MTTAPCTRPASDDGYNSGGGVSQSNLHNTSFGSSSTKSMTPPSSTSGLPNHSVIQRRGSTVSMPPGDLESGPSVSHCGSTSPQKPPIPDKPPPIARKPSLKPAMKIPANPPSVSDYNQAAPHQTTPQVLEFQHEGVVGDPYATLKPNRG